MDGDAARRLERLLRGGDWLGRVTEFGHRLRRSAGPGEDLLLVGTEEEEPWHLAAHLAEEVRFGGGGGPRPVLVRHAPPPGAPSHLRIGLERLERVGRSDAVLVVAAGSLGAGVLERLAAARRSGASVLAIDQGDEAIGEVAEETLVVGEGLSRDRRARTLLVPGDAAFDAAQHLVSIAVAEGGSPQPAGRLRRLADRLAR